MKSLKLVSFFILFTSGWSSTKKTIRVEKYPFPFKWEPAFKTIMNVGDKKEATICLKFRTFRYNEGFGDPFFIRSFCPEDRLGYTCEDRFYWEYGVGWKTGLEDDNKQAGYSGIHISHGNLSETEEQSLRASKTRWHFHLYEKSLDLFEWQSVCYSLSIIQKKELIFINGKFLHGYKFSKQFEKGWGNDPIEINLATNWVGEITDFNIYDSAFDKEQMISWTTSCNEPELGELFPWDTLLFNFTNTDEISVAIGEANTKDLCLKETDGNYVLELFSDGVLKSWGMSAELCERLNGRLSLVPQIETEAFALLKEHIDYVTAVNVTYTIFWLGGRAFINETELEETEEGYQVYPKGGKWVIQDPYSGNVLGKPFVVSNTAHTYSKVTQECVTCYVGM